MTKMQHTRLTSGELEAAASKEDIRNSGWVARLNVELGEILERVSALVRQESPSSHSDAVNAAQRVVATWAEELGADVKRHARSDNKKIIKQKVFNNAIDAAKCYDEWVIEKFGAEAITNKKLGKL